MVGSKRPSVKLDCDYAASDAVDLLLRLGTADSDEQEREGWLQLGANAMYRIWDNEDDAVYDNWRELYGADAVRGAGTCD
jgi:hypothetical protein